MDYFLAFFGKSMSWSGICIEEEEISEILKDGSQNIPDDSISSDVHGSSSGLVSHLPAAISSCNTGSDNDGPINSHWSSAENKKAKVHFPGISIKEVISEESSSACSQRDSLQSHSGVNYDDDSLKEILICPQKTSTEPDSGPVKRKKKASKEKRDAMEINLLNNQNEQLTGEAATRSHSDSQSSNPTTPISSNANAVSVSSTTLISEESSAACSLRDSLQSHSVINYDDDNSPKEILICLQKMSTEPDSGPMKRKKKASKEKSDAMEINLLNNQNEQLTGEAATRSHSDSQSSNPTTPISSNANAVSVSSTTLISEESSAACSLRDSLQSHSGIKYDDADSPKEILASPQKTSTELDSGHVKSKKKASKEKNEAMEINLLNNQNEQLTGEAATRAHSDSQSSNPTTPISSNANADSVSSATLISEESSSACSQRDSLQSHSVINYDDDDSLKEILTSPQKTSTEPDSGAVKSKKNASKKKQKVMKISLLNNQNEQLTGEASTRSHFDPQSSNPTTPISSNANAVSVVDGKIQGYCSSNKILLVGEGDFSFSACLAKAFGSATNMVATSLNSKAYLKRYYKNTMNNIFELRSRGCKVLHQVDATSMAIHKSLAGLSFNQIIYNFPHCGDFSKTEIALRENQSLVKLFMENSSKIIEENGEIHIRHKVTPFFSKWNLRGLASEAGLVLIEKAPFDVCEFEGYNTKYGFKGDNNFDCHPSCTYKFVLSKRQKKLRRQSAS